MRARHPPASRGSCCHTRDFLRRSDSSSATTGIRPPAPGGTSAGDSPTSIAAFETQKESGKPQIAGSLHQANTGGTWATIDRKSTRLNSSHGYISYAVFCLKKKKKYRIQLYLARAL